MYYEEEKYSNKGNSFFVFDEVNSDLDDYVVKPLSLDDMQLLTVIGNIEEYIELLKKLNS